MLEREQLQHKLSAAAEELERVRTKQRESDMIFQASAVLSTLTASAGLRVGKDHPVIYI